MLARGLTVPASRAGILVFTVRSPCSILETNSHFDQSLLAQIPKLSDSKACAFSYHISLFSKENKCSDESRPESIHLLFGLMEASLGTSIQGNESIQGTPDFQTASCAQGLTLFCTLLSLDILILCDPDSLYPSNQRH